MTATVRKRRRLVRSGGNATVTQRPTPDAASDAISDASEPEPTVQPPPKTPAAPPMAVPSVQGFAQWNLERCPEVLEVIRSKWAQKKRPLRIFSMYTGWGTSEMVAHAVQAEFKRLGLDVEFEVAWICEANVTKCRYLMSAFPDVPYIFTDASEVAQGIARDFRSGRKLVVPTDLDLGFVGYPCIDLSSLNVLPGQFMDTTTATGKGYSNMLKLVDRSDNLLFLGVENSANMWRKRKEDQFHRPIDIQDAAFRQRNFVSTSHCVSAHEFGPPQSRRRSWSLYFKSKTTGAAEASKIFLSFRCALVPLERFLEPTSVEGTTEEQHEAHGQAHGTKWVGQFEHLCSNLDQARLSKKLSEVTARQLPLTARELHVVAFAAYQLEGRKVDLEKRQVVIQVDQNFGRSHRADARIAPCIIPKGKYVVTGAQWRLLGTREKCFLQGVGPAEIDAYQMEKRLSKRELSDMAGNAFTAQICLAALLTSLAVIDL